MPTTDSWPRSGDAGWLCVLWSFRWHLIRRRSLLDPAGDLIVGARNLEVSSLGMVWSHNLQSHGETSRVEARRCHLLWAMLNRLFTDTFSSKSGTCEIGRD